MAGQPNVMMSEAVTYALLKAAMRVRWQLTRRQREGIECVSCGRDLVVEVTAAAGPAAFFRTDGCRPAVCTTCVAEHQVGIQLEEQYPAWRLWRSRGSGVAGVGAWYATRRIALPAPLRRKGWPATLDAPTLDQLEAKLAERVHVEDLLLAGTARSPRRESTDPSAREGDRDG
ncbi:hypothetical protein ACFWYW_14685 [Nonomuraea sp. NPDC059023]|uniref:hypothetical protein n=1 Tax=unclassified Nonomuraea TaxID=2593643 RepID=UPI0036B89442